MSAMELTLSGPIFDGRADAAMTAYQAEALSVVGDLVADDVRSTLLRSVKHPTGFYEGRIIANRATGGVLVTDSDVVYGPWLEGTATRNETTRFKGYAAFRRTAQTLASSNRIERALEEAFPPFAGRME